jgi:hypothetical protein
MWHGTTDARSGMALSMVGKSAGAKDQRFRPGARTLPMGDA